MLRTGFSGTRAGLGWIDHRLVLDRVKHVWARSASSFRTPPSIQSLGIYWVTALIKALHSRLEQFLKPKTLEIDMGQRSTLHAPAPL